MRVVLTICGFVMLSFLSAVSLAASKSNELVTAEVNSSVWLSAFNRGDTQALSELYTDDAVVMPPDSEILSGTVAIKSYWDGLRGVGVKDFHVYTINSRQNGDTIYQSAVWEATRYPDAGEEIRFDGNIYNVLQKQKDGSWKIRLQSWN